MLEKRGKNNWWPEIPLGALAERRTPDSRSLVGASGGADMHGFSGFVPPRDQSAGQ